MKALYLILRVIGVLAFMLLAVGYYREAHYIHGIFAAALGGVAGCAATNFPRGLKAKVVVLSVGVVMILALHPL